MTYYDLGNYGRKITTGSADAQLWFDRGLVWLYAYNHEAAITCFRKALEADAGCAMAHWGIAAASGPNYNQPWEGMEPEEREVAVSTARAAVSAAQGAGDGFSPAERDLIDAVAKRFPIEPVEDIAPWLDAYADAMREVHRANPQDLDVAALFAEAMMNRTPWQLWNLTSGKPADGADTEEARDVLERALGLPGAWDHPGLLHFYIHLMEMSPTPELALRHGDRLSTLVPDAGHLIHMGTHIDVLCGDYHNVVSKNSKAIEADRKWLDHEGADNFYTVYRCHNYHFKIYGAMFLGQPEPALAAAEELIETLPEEGTLRQMADWFEAFVPMKMHVLIRFGMWDDILASDLPEDSKLYTMTTAMMHYARTVALANTGDIPAAQAEREKFDAAHKAVPDSRMLFNNTCQDILKVAEAMMLGEMEYKKGNREAAFEHLRQSVALDDNLPYDEPWGWMQPTRHALGALLLDADRLDEAEAVYRADLGLDDTLARACQHPANVWSLHGLHECLIRRGEKVEAMHVKRLLDRALARAEVPVRASCYCRGAAA
jgi:tetratricopeptide (TPR) repeat protein